MAVRSQDANDIIKDIQRTLGRAVDKLFKDINTNTASATPIATGRARRGWRKTRVYNLGYTGKMVENLVPYIGILDRGHSKQAPAGYVRREIERQVNRRPRKL